MQFKIGYDVCEECGEEREFYQLTIDKNKIREKVIARFFLLKDGLIFLPRR